MRPQPRTILTVLLLAALIAPASFARKKATKGKAGTAQVAATVDAIAYPPLPEIRVVEPERTTLANGMQLLLMEDHELPLVQAVAFFRTGSQYEPADQVGLAGLTGTVMRSGGTTSMPRDVLNSRLENMAAVIETSIGTNSGQAFMSCLRDDLSTVLPMLADVLRRPAFDEDEIAVTKTQIEAGIARQNDNPGQILGREFQELLLGEDSAFARSVTYDSIGSIERDDLVAWHARFVHPENVILALAGDFDHAEAKALVESAFGDWARSDQALPEAPSLEAAYEPGISFIEKTDVTQSNIQIGHLGIRRDNPDYYAVEVMNQVLGGGFASRLFSNVRSKKGLAYSVGGGIGSQWDRPGIFSMRTSTKTETTAAAIDALLEEANNLTAQPPTEEEVDRAKRSILNSFVFTADDTRKVVNQQLVYAYHGYPSDWMRRYQEGIGQVTTEQVRAAAAKYIDPDQFAILVVGPREGLDRPLDSFGTVRDIDISIPEPSAKTVEVTEEGKAQGAALIARAFAAVGGERIDQMQSFRLSGDTELHTPQGELWAKTVQLTVFPVRQRTDITLPFGTMVQVLDGDNSWMQTPQGVQPLPASMRADLEKSARRSVFSLLRARNDPDFVAVAAGKDSLDDSSLSLVQVQTNGEAITLGIDDDTGLVRTMAYRGNNGGVPGDLFQVLRDFRPIDGVAVAHNVEVTFNGEPMIKTNLSAAEIDPTVDDQAFAKPE